MQNQQSNRRLIRARRRALVCLLVSVLAIFWSTSDGQAQASGKTKIGLSVPLSGTASKLARDYADGASEALENSLSRQSLELLVVDDGCDPDLADLAAEDLIDREIEIVFGYFCNQAAEIASERLASRGIPMIITDARGSLLLEDAVEKNWPIWRAAPGENAVAEKAAKLLTERWREASFAIVDDGTIFARNLADQFRITIEENGLKSTLNDNLRPLQSTQAPLLRRLQQAGVTAAFIAATPEDTRILASDAAELDIGIEFVGIEGLEILPFLETEKPVPAGLLGIIDMSTATNPGAKQINLLREADDLPPASPYFLKGYAAMQLAIEIWRDGGKPLADKTYETILGLYRFGLDQTNTINPFQLMRWNGVAFQPVDPRPRQVNPQN